MTAAEPPDEAIVVRLIWTPEDVVRGKVLPTAFPKADLKTPARYMSVDRADSLCPPVMRCVACQQHTSAAEANTKAAAKAEVGEQANPNPPRRRDHAYSAQLQCGAIRALEATVEENKVKKTVKPLDVEPKRIEPGGDPCPLGNDAHCAILNRSAHKGDGFLLLVRTKLADLAFDVLPLETLLHARGERRLPPFDSDTVG